MDHRAVAAHIAAGGPVQAAAGAFMVRCPAHNDGRPSLHVSRGTTHPVLLRCFAGCENEDILREAKLTWDDISKPMDDEPVSIAKHQGVLDEWTPGGNAVAVYSYHDEDGGLLFQVLRTAEKQFFQRTPDATAKRGYRWNMNGTRRVLYHLPDVIECGRNGQEVWVTEGEKDADRLRAEGECATSSPMGAGKWRDEYADALRGSSVTIVADNDETGRAHARTIRESLVAHDVGRVRVVEAASGKDISDHLDAGLALDAVNVTHPYEEVQKTRLALDLDDYLAQPLPEQRFVIEGTLAKGEVMLVTGYEGMGKSTLMKQIAVQCAYGFHPFVTGKRMRPVRVMFVDAENKTPDNHADFFTLRWRAQQNGGTDREPLYIIETGPLDVGQPAGRETLLERVRAHQPDLLIIGPIYNLVGRDLRSEDDARALKLAIDTIQESVGCAVIMETHVPHGGPDGRELRPIGSTILMRWPSFGFGLLPITDSAGNSDVSLWKPWRGGRRRNRLWPTGLRKGGGIEWMWEPADDGEIARAELGSRPF